MQNTSGYLREAALAALIIIGIGAAARSQTPSPSPTATPAFSDIFIVDVKNERGGMRFGPPVKITAFAGYNNQPFFLPDGRSILYTSIRDRQAEHFADRECAKRESGSRRGESRPHPAAHSSSKQIQFRAQDFRSRMDDQGIRFAYPHQCFAHGNLGGSRGLRVAACGRAIDGEGFEGVFFTSLARKKLGRDRRLQ